MANARKQKIRNSNDQLMECFNFHLGRLNPEFDWGVVGVSMAETYFKSVLRTGSSLILNFRAWGNTEHEVMENLNFVFTTMFEAAQCVSQAIAGATARDAS